MSPRHAADRSEEDTVHQYMLTCHRDFHGSNRLHLCFDGFTISGEKVLNILAGNDRTGIYCWLPPQAHQSTQFNASWGTQWLEINWIRSVGVALQHPNTHAPLPTCLPLPHIRFLHRAMMIASVMLSVGTASGQ